MGINKMNVYKKAKQMRGKNKNNTNEDLGKRNIHFPPYLPKKTSLKTDPTARSIAS